MNAPRLSQTIIMCVFMMLSLAAPAWPAAPQDSAKGYQDIPRNYIIGPSDIIEVVAWREDAVSRGEVLVRPDGKISLPLVDDVQAAGLTPMALKEELTKALQRFLESPKVYIIIKDPRSHYFSVLGNVTRPGSFPLLKPTTVMHALALAEGFNEWASKNSVTILRGRGEEQSRLPFSYSDVISGKALEQNINLQPGDIIVVP